ncbi:Fatty acid oxidation complex subunit alpha [Streptomyces antimycoticus]
MPDVSELPEEADLVVEAVPEITALKADVLTAVEQVVSARTVLATNTSSLSVSELSAALEHPERFLGMHFFNPVPASKMVEVVTSPATSDTVRDQVLGYARSAREEGRARTRLARVRHQPPRCPARSGSDPHAGRGRRRRRRHRHRHGTGLRPSHRIRCAPPISSASMCVWPSPTTCIAPSETGSPHRNCYVTRSPRRATGPQDRTGLPRLASVTSYVLGVSDRHRPRRALPLPLPAAITHVVVHLRRPERPAPTNYSEGRSRAHRPGAGHGRRSGTARGPAHTDRRPKDVPLGRTGTVKDAADAVLFLRQCPLAHHGHGN